MSDRTLPPTPRRRDEARRLGVVARSGALTGACVLLAGVLMLRLAPPSFDGVMRDGLSTIHEAEPDTLVGRLTSLATVAAWAILPFAFAIVVVALAVNLAQVGFVFSPLAPGRPQRSFWRPAHAVLALIVAVTVGVYAGGSEPLGPLTWCAAALVLLGLIDYAVARRRVEHELMMTPEEVRREERESRRAGGAR
jgi:flagellar biosynthetic protein FlhB